MIKRVQEAVQKLPGNNFEFTQPIQMRINELLAGTRGDLAVKVFGEEFETMLPAANQIATILRGIAGAQDVRVEQVTGLPSSPSRSTKPKSRGSASANSRSRT